MSSRRGNYNEGRASISFIDQSDPPFIESIKQRLDYKAPAIIDDKFSTTTTDDGYIENDLEEDDLSRVNREDRPQVVVLDAKNDLNEKEVEAELEKKRAEEDRRKIEKGEIIFRKPTKRKEESPEKKHTAKRRHAEGRTNVVGSDKRLLSFNDDEEDG